MQPDSSFRRFVLNQLVGMPGGQEMSAILKRRTRPVQDSPYELEKIRVFGGFILEP